MGVAGQIVGGDALIGALSNAEVATLADLGGVTPTKNIQSIPGFHVWLVDVCCSTDRIHLFTLLCLLHNRFEP